MNESILSDVLGEIGKLRDEMQSYERRVAEAIYINSLTKKRFLSIEEFALYVDRTPKGVRSMINKGQLSYSNKFGRIQIDREAYDRDLALSLKAAVHVPDVESIREGR